MKQRSIIGPRDISVFYTLYLHPALSLKQLAELCFPDVSFETARKRLRRLHQSGYMEAKAIEGNSEKGRPERLYFLNAKSAKALSESKNIPQSSISISAPNTKHQEYLAHLAQLHLAWQKTAKEKDLLDHFFITRRALNINENPLTGNENADATISFTNKHGKKHNILVILETGNLRPTRHWIPKMTALLKTGISILIVTTSRHRLDTLRKWTLPMLEEFGIPNERCMFMVYEEIIRYGFLSISAYSTTGSAMKIPA